MTALGDAPNRLEPVAALLRTGHGEDGANARWLMPQFMGLRPLDPPGSGALVTCVALTIASDPGELG
jgi:hypothetical protein